MSRFNQDKPPKTIPKYDAAPKTVKDKPTIDPRNLTEGQRKTLWSGIQRDNPALAELLKNDAIIAALKEHFNAHIIFYAAEATDYMKD